MFPVSIYVIGATVEQPKMIQKGKCWKDWKAENTQQFL